MQASNFSQLDLIEPLRRALHDEGYQTPTPIQAAAIPHLLGGRDLLGCAQTGTGKTAAFALPILQRLEERRRPAGPNRARVLVLAPTRELASQIDDSFRAYGRHLRFTRAVVFGGVGQHPQVRALSRGVDVLVATPGRLLDLVEQGYLRFDGLEVFVLDEADRMLDMGFIHDVKRIIALLPSRRQTLLFSATMPADIAELAAKMLHDPVEVSVTPPASTVEKVQQMVCFVERSNKSALLEDLLDDPNIERALVFARTKHGANRIARQLVKASIEADAIHGNKSQHARERALEAFRTGDIRVLVATDIAARGIDVDGISHVINFDLPNIPEAYVHRIGRTARAGRSGVAISFCDQDERPWLRDIERLIRQKVPVGEEHPYHAADIASGQRRAALPAKPARSRHGPPRKPSNEMRNEGGESGRGRSRTVWSSNRRRH